VLVHHHFDKQQSRAQHQGPAEDRADLAGSELLPLNTPEFLRGSLYATYYKPSKLDDLKLSVTVAAPRAKVCVLVSYMLSSSHHGDGAFVTTLPLAGFKMVTEITAAANDTMEVKSGPWEPIRFTGVWCKDVSAGSLYLPRPYGVVAMGVAVLFTRCSDVPEVCSDGTVLAPGAKYLFGGTRECCCVQPRRTAGALLSSDAVPTSSG